MKQTFHERKKERTEHYEKYIKGWKLRPCGACNGSGYYDHNGSPDCGACDGTGKERYNPEQERLQHIEFLKTPEGPLFFPIQFIEFTKTEEGQEFIKTEQGQKSLEFWNSEKCQDSLKLEEQRLAIREENKKRGMRYGI